ncbi:MAG: hypothetical protein ACLUDK_16440 [Clostridium paraputrificum]
MGKINDYIKGKYNYELSPEEQLYLQFILNVLFIN